MPNLRVALAQSNTTVGAIDANAESLLDWCRRAHEAGAQLVLTPEMALTGYPVEDLALRRGFVSRSAQVCRQFATRLADAGLAELVVVLGYLDSTSEANAPGRRTPAPQNRLAVLHRGQVMTTYAKHHLPNYGVFDESRYFHPGDEFVVVTVGGVDVGFAICEDLWQDGGPVVAAREAGVGLLAVLNASPYEANKDDARGGLVSSRAVEAGCALAYVNLVGGQDELVFDGDSMISSAQGELVVRGPQFVEELVLADLDLPASRLRSTDGTPDPRAGGTPDPRAGGTPDPRAGGTPDPRAGGTPNPRAESRGPAGTSGMTITHQHLTDAAAAPTAPLPTTQYPRLDDLTEIWSALTLGLRDYCRKSGITDVWLGLSGGIDSTVVAALACDALGADHVHGVSNPSAWSSDHSKSDAIALAEATGLDFSTIPIGPLVDAFHEAVELDGVAAENVQARIRGVLWMALSNQSDQGAGGGPSIVLACSNKSELAVGYSTMYGDAVGGFAPIKDVPKTQVWELARWRNAEAVRRGETPPIPENAISKPPSAELRPGQQDSDSLPPYEVLDVIIDHYVESDRSLDEIVAEGFDRDLVLRITRMVDRAEYKRRQFPPGTKISFKAFGRDRRLPIVNGWRDI